MFLTHCTMGWMLLAVLSVCVPVWSSMKVMQPYRVVSTNGAAQIHCVIHPRTAFSQNHLDQNLENPFFNAEDVRVTLLRGLHGSQKVCSSTLNISEQQETQREKDGDVKCAVQIKGGAVEVALSGLKATHTDIYRCGIQILYPPPYQQLTGNGTLLHVLESPRCPVQEPQRLQGQEEEENLETKTAVSIPVVILVIVIICVLVVIITFQTLQCQQGRREPVRMPPNILLQKVDAVPFSSGTMA
ncbi:cytotoxic T-lymphocyte protein 4 [Fundulus diaphanus]